VLMVCFSAGRLADEALEDDKAAVLEQPAVHIIGSDINGGTTTTCREGRRRCSAPAYTVARYGQHAAGGRIPDRGRGKTRARAKNSNCP
jgi:hypothetical protein